MPKRKPALVLCAKCAGSKKPKKVQVRTVTRCGKCGTVVILSPEVK